MTKKVVIKITGVSNSQISVSGANMGDNPTIRLEGLSNVNLNTEAVLKLLRLASDYETEKNPIKRGEIENEIIELCNCSREQAQRILIINKPA